MARSAGISRAQVIATAAMIADEAGYERLALAHIAAHLGVKLPSLYNHIDGLEALRRELALLGTRQLTERLTAAAVGKAGNEAVIAAARAYRNFVLERPGLYAASVRAPAPDDAEHRALSDAALRVILAILADYRLPGDELIHAARGLRAIVHGFATIEHMGGFGLALDHDASFARLLDAYLVGLRGASPLPPERIP